MKRTHRDSHCPVNFSLESFGDSWSLLIVRDIVYMGKKTFREFLASDEAISSNILAARLKHLQEVGILTKKPHPTDKRKEVYELTEKGLGLIPIVMEMAGWGATYDDETIAPKEFVAYVYAHRDEMYELIRETVKNGGSLFVGEKSIVNMIKQS